MSSVGPWESVGGDIKFLRLKQREIGGLVTDGSVRDTDEIINCISALGKSFGDLKNEIKQK